MSPDKTSSTNGRPILKPSLPSHGRPAPRVPFTPRVAVSAASGTGRAGTLSPAGRPIVKAPSPKVPQQHKQDDGVGTANAGVGNVTPRSAARSLRADNGQQNDTLSLRPRSTGNAGSTVGSEKAYTTRPRSMIGEPGSGRERFSPVIRTAEYSGTLVNGNLEERFFHASDVQKQEPAPKKPEPKRAPAFFYADGKQEPSFTQSPENVSPAVSSVAPLASAAMEQVRTSTQPYSTATLPRSPVVSPGFSQSGGSPFFPSPSNQSPGGMRSPSPSKENIHLSYRKGVSQIFGSRPFPLSQTPYADLQSQPIAEEPGSATRSTIHRKASSISSLDSGSSPSSRRRSGTTAEGGFVSSSPLAQEFKSSALISLDQPRLDLTSIEQGITPGGDGPLSPTKGVTELAAEARRERKVLDLEISNSSLLAINSSLEREVRRQKAELKRFRRLSRAGRFSFAPGDVGRRRSSDAMSTLNEDDEEGSNVESDDGLNDMDLSSDEESDSGGSSEAMSERRQSREHDRLAKDEKRLRVDLARHKELLTQSQMMNQSIKRCMYATESMIADGRKALEYHVRVSDVKLGGRILTEHDDDDSRHEIEVDDDEFSSEVLRTGTGSQDGDEIEGADQLLKVWQGVGRRSIESSEGGDRDSSIEVDKSYFPMTHHHTPHVQTGGSEASALPPVLPG